MGFLGSTNIAYGPEDDNDSADSGMSLLPRVGQVGRFAGTIAARSASAVAHCWSRAGRSGALKTVGQFLLLGDPSLHAVAGAKPKTRPTAKTMARSAATTASAHAITRGALTETAALLTRGADSVKTGVRSTSNDTVRSKIASVAGKAGMATSGPVRAFQVSAAPDPSARDEVVRRAPKGMRTGAKSTRPGSIRFHVCFATTTDGQRNVVGKARGKAKAKARAGAKPITPPPAGVQRHAVLIAREQGGRVTIKKLFARFSPTRYRCRATSKAT